jgi:hypothetical protein
MTRLQLRGSASRAMIRSIEILNKLKPRNFRFTPEVREVVRELCETYVGTVPEERVKLREALASDFVLFWFAHDMAVLAVRENSTERIRHGLVAVVIEDARRDQRDTLFPIAVLYYSASKIGADPNQLFTWAASIASPRMQALLKEFMNRPASKQDIAKFGFKEVQTEAGFDYADSH